MDWKILTLVLAGLVVFFTYRQCSETQTPDYDQIQTQQQAQRQQQYEQQQAQLRQQQSSALKAEVRASRGTRPAPKLAVLETDDYVATFTTRGGALQTFKLKGEQFKELPRDWDSGLRDEDADELVPVDLVTTNVAVFEHNAHLRFEVYQGLDALLAETDYELVRQDGAEVLFKYQQPGLPVIIYKKFELQAAAQPFQVWLTIRVVNSGSEKVSFYPGVVQQGYQHPSEAKGGMFSKQPNIQQAICRSNDDVTRAPWAQPGEGDLPFRGIGDIDYVGVESNYFIAAILPGDDRPASCYLHAVSNRVLRAELRWGETVLAPGESALFNVKNYLGPKKYSLLQSVGHNLESSVDFGWFAPICKVLLWMLFWFQSVVINWGVAIILLTVVVKLALIPLTHRSFKSAEKMKALKPQVDALNAKHKDDPQGKQQATMELYKTNGVNPLGGCLPTLLQMPIWFALFRTLRAAPELYHAKFFGWITDLSSPDPLFITPIVMGAMMFLQQRFTPMSGDSAQQKMMGYMMPVMFTGFMLFLPSGLTLYILVNTVLSIAHQVIIHRRPTPPSGAVKKSAKTRVARKK